MDLLIVENLQKIHSFSKIFTKLQHTILCRGGKEMTSKDFLKLEAKVLLESFNKENEDLLIDLVQHGLAEGIRIYAELLNYDITEIEIKRIIISKIINRYLLH
ncbi:MAG: hypothetical protein NZ928_05595 [Endomicrobia bacterium]|nr:hypothetical protein [Endomicrobiia bacterium]